MYYDVTISPAAGGFGEWEHSGAHGDGWADEADLVTAMAQGVSGGLYELGVDDLPAGIEDIRGLIRSEPPRVFATLDADGAGGATFYFGIVESR